MSIEYVEKSARFVGAASVEDAEALLEWFLEHPEGDVDLSACEHLHAADLQVLMAAGCRVSAWPEDGRLSSLLKNAIYFSRKE